MTKISHTVKVYFQALKAKKTIVLAQEPDGDRHGLVGEQYEDTPLTVTAFGDSMAAACGTSDQSHGLIPQLCTLIADRIQRPIQWKTTAKLGATLRRVRYRQITTLQEDQDVVIICAGSNDILANRRLDDQWKRELVETIHMAQQHAQYVIVFPAGQLYSIPALGKDLKMDIKKAVFKQAHEVEKICREEHAVYLEWTHDIPCGDKKWFWCSDCFHPSYEGYHVIAEFLFNKIHTTFFDQLSAL